MRGPCEPVSVWRRTFETESIQPIRKTGLGLFPHRAPSVCVSTALQALTENRRRSCCRQGRYPAGQRGHSNAGRETAVMEHSSVVREKALTARLARRLNIDLIRGTP